MSASTKDVTETVRITVCDLCGEEIFYDKDDREASGTIGQFNPERENPHKGHPTSKTPRVTFKWPIGKAKRLAEEAKARAESERRGLEVTVADVYVNTTYYDFHGECLAKLVEAGVELRKRKERPDYKPEPTPVLMPAGSMGEAIAGLGNHYTVEAEMDPDAFLGVAPPAGSFETVRKLVKFHVRSKEDWEA